MDIKQKIIDKISDCLTVLSKDQIECMIENPPNTEMGDYAFPCFQLAKVLKKSPNSIAVELSNELESIDGIREYKVIGGYINFFVDPSIYIRAICEKFDEKDVMYGSSQVGNGKNIVLDFSAPNIAKPFHVGHLRSTVIGNAIYKLYQYLGYNCISVNHIGDWGTQFGKLIVAYKLWGSKRKIEEDGIKELMRIYVKFHEEAENNPKIEQEARTWFTNMEKGNKEALELWKWFKDISLQEFERVYKLLGVSFDSYNGESFYNDKMDEIIQLLDQKGLLQESEGAKIIDLSDDKMPPCLITKNDGSTLYATRDITAAIYRKRTYDFEKCIYVTALAQNLHFAQWFKVIEKMGYDWSSQLVHVPFGLISMETGKLSTRKGNVVLLEELLEQSIDKTKSIIQKKNPDLEDQEQVARNVGIGAILFNDLSNNRIKDVIFSWENVLNFDGETGPYVQYTHARASSVLRKAKYNNLENKKIYYNMIDDEYTINLCKLIDQFPKKIEDAAEKLEPSLLTRHIIDIAKAFNKFYHECPILVEDEKLRNSRLKLVYIVKIILWRGLNLLGIQAPEKM